LVVIMSWEGDRGWRARYEVLAVIMRWEGDRGLRARYEVLAVILSREGERVLGWTCFVSNFATECAGRGWRSL
jgi:hypothetical protein